MLMYKCIQWIIYRSKVWTLDCIFGKRLCLRAASTLASVRICTGSPESALLDRTIKINYTTCKDHAHTNMFIILNPGIRKRVWVCGYPKIKVNISKQCIYRRMRLFERHSNTFRTQILSGSVTFLIIAT